jgi:flavin-dependent dehydrogenase
MRDAVEHLVIGGGPAGSMLAIHLASAGHDVMLLEKEREPHHKVCGEFLSREAIQYLRNAGIDPRRLGAESIQQVRLHSGCHTTGAPLPFHALSLSRYVLDEAVLRRAAACGCEVRRGTFVSHLHGVGNGWEVQLRGGGSIRAKAVSLATGKHDLKEAKRGKGFQNDLVGFKMHWKLASSATQSLRDVMELFLFRGGYGGLVLVEGGTANLCIVVRQKVLCEAGGWPQLLGMIQEQVPALGEKLRGAEPCWPKPVAISSIPYGYLAGRSDGLWRVGDQAAVIPSFTGDGMAIALHSAVLAGEMYCEGKSPDECLRHLRAQLRAQMYFATALSKMMVTSAGRLIAPAVLSATLMRWIAETTRIPARALGEVRTASGTIVTL